jgi:hypothetical protein
MYKVILYILKKCQENDKWILLCIIKQFYNAYFISCKLHKMIIFGKPNIPVIIITMLETFSKKIAHIWKCSIILILIETVGSLIHLCNYRSQLKSYCDKTCRYGRLRESHSNA